MNKKFSQDRALADADSLARLFATPLTILAGDQDTETNDPHLPSEPAALRQGPHRYARALHYFATAQAEAGCTGPMRGGWPKNVNTF